MDYMDFLGSCLDCGTQLTEENTYPKKNRDTNWRRCISCIDKRRSERQKTCIWCGVILTIENTYKGGPIAYSYCKKHNNSRARLRDYDTHVSIQETRPEKDLGTCTDCGLPLTYTNAAWKNKRGKIRCIDCDAKYIESTRSQAPTTHCLHCGILITDSNRGDGVSKLYPYCNLHLTLQHRRALTLKILE